MNNNKKLIGEISNLNSYEFKILKQEVKKRIIANEVAFYLETNETDLVCPHCKSHNKTRWGIRSNLQRYKCKECNKTYNSLTKTPLARLRKKDLWLKYSKCLRDELTVRKSAYECKVHKTTAFRWRHRFVSNSEFIKSKFLRGVIDMNDIYFKESFKGSRNIPQRARRDVCVIHSIDRHNNIYDLTDQKLSLKNLNSDFKNLIEKGTIVVSDKNKVYKEFSYQNKLKFKKHINEKESRTRAYKNDKVKDYSERFESWVVNYFRGVATKYLKNYVSWFRGLNEFPHKIRPLTILVRAKSIQKYGYQPLKHTELFNQLGI